MKNTPEEIKSRLADVEQWINNLEDKVMERSKLKSKRKKNF